MRIKVITISVLVALCLVCSETKAATFGKPHWKSYSECTEEEYHKSLLVKRKSPKDVFCGLLKRVRLSCITFKSAMAKDEVPGDSMYFINLNFSHEF
ncbi:MAG: hypothetical protein K940chlam3_00023 [Chlamydiae bacterium]|nr:hypothetical protein [Chlamydiota bacterium]